MLHCTDYWRILDFQITGSYPLKVVNSQGDVLTTQEQITGGQAVFQKYGLMDYATVLGYGSYLGPDYTAESLKIMVDAMHDQHAVWNLLGAGVLGFLINLPAVSYFEHGSTLTTAHAHGSMMGVYGMFAVAVLLYSLRNIVKSDQWNDQLLRLSCWGLNIGLTGMIVITLLPVGFMQLKRAFDFGLWSARDFSFYQDGTVNLLLWIRMIPDTIFIVLGILPLVFVVARSMFHLRKPNVNEEENFQ